MSAVFGEHPTHFILFVLYLGCQREFRIPKQLARQVSWDGDGAASGKSLKSN
jgi:hypothetical protein